MKCQVRNADAILGGAFLHQCYSISEMVHYHGGREATLFCFEVRRPEDPTIQPTRERLPKVSNLLLCRFRKRDITRCSVLVFGRKADHSVMCSQRRQRISPARMAVSRAIYYS